MTLVHKDRTGDPVGERFPQIWRRTDTPRGPQLPQRAAWGGWASRGMRRPRRQRGGAQMKETDWRVWGRHTERRPHGLRVASLWPSPLSPTHQGLPGLFPYSPNTARSPPGLPRTFRDGLHCSGALERPRAAAGARGRLGAAPIPAAREGSTVKLPLCSPTEPHTCDLGLPRASLKYVSI